MMEIAYWCVREAWRVAEQSYRYMGHKRGILLANEDALIDARQLLYWAKAVGDFRNPFIPPDFPTPQLYMPAKGFAPDYFGTGIYQFVSRRLREALALPDGIAQYIPIELLSGGPEVRAQDYCWMNLLACYPAIDLQRSAYTMSKGLTYASGEKFEYIDSYERMVIRGDIRPAAEMFRVAEDLTTVLASDALAERVLRAGCTGIAFEDPATARNFGPIKRYRTATGVEEEDMDKIPGPIR